MSTTEHTMNDVLAALLRQTRSAWRSSDIVKSENIGLIKGSNARPDILILEPNVSPVVVETEVIPAVTVEADALSRLGKELRGTGRAVLSVVAARLPKRLRGFQGDTLREELSNAIDIDMALLTGKSPEEFTRWPTSGWVQGDVSYLSLLIQSASVPPAVIEEAADNLAAGVMEAAEVLENMAGVHPGAMQRISGLLHQEYDAQTRRMATAILANAFMFHESLSGGQGELASVRTLEELRGSLSGLSKSSVLSEWRKILAVNYWPIFDIARRILEVIPAEGSAYLIDILSNTADKLLRKSLLRSHDLMGSVFQRLIADRKFLAAFYTKPASASLLIGLALRQRETPSGDAWGDTEAVTSMKVADFACGTGTLLSTAYQRIGQLHELAGGDAEAIHEDMMASSLVGCDVLPAAAHLTASMLSGAHPTVKYSGSVVLTVPYGLQENGGIALGSLDLLNPQGTFEILSITSRALQGEGDIEKHAWAEIDHQSMDLVVMNPPFTRATNHERRIADAPIPMFAAFTSSAEEQRKMASASKEIAKGTCYHGNAGEASLFVELAHRMLKVNGTLALVMPMTLLSGSSWEKTRKLLFDNYSGLILVTIAGAGSSETAFSADTGMAECLLVGRKEPMQSKRGVFVVLMEAPSDQLSGAELARVLNNRIQEGHLRKLEDGPIGGSSLYNGDDFLGYALDVPIPRSGSWGIMRILDMSLAQSAYHLARNECIWLPTQSKDETSRIPMTLVGDIGLIGPYHLDVSKKYESGKIRGPFNVHDIRDGSSPTYPILWSHDAARERTLQFSADREGVPFQANSASAHAEVMNKVKSVWGTASHCHSNLDFRFNSQSTSMQFTTRKTIGGRAWLSVQLHTSALEKALVLWANTTLGLLLIWWHSSKQQSGRGIMTKTTLRTLPVLDVTALSEMQIQAAVRIFDEMSDKPMKPIHEIAEDPVRRELDERLLGEVLGLDKSIYASDGPLDLLRNKLGAEPSIRGSK